MEELRGLEVISIIEQGHNMTPSSSTSGYLSKGNKNTNLKRYFVAVVFVILAKTWEKPKYPWMDEWIKKCGVCTHTHTHVCTCTRVYVYILIHTMEYHSATENKEILPLGATGMDHEGITLSEISETKKERYWVSSLTHRIWKKQNTSS